MQFRPVQASSRPDTAQVSDVRLVRLQEARLGKAEGGMVVEGLGTWAAFSGVSRCSCTNRRSKKTWQQGKGGVKDGS